MQRISSIPRKSKTPAWTKAPTSLAVRDGGSMPVKFRCLYKKCRKWKTRQNLGPSRPAKYCSPECGYKARRVVQKYDNSHLAKDDGAAIMEAEREREIRQLREQQRRLLVRVGAADRIVMSAASFMKTLPTVRPPKPIKPSGKDSPEEAFLGWTDHHIGAKFSAAEMGGLNFYDVDEYTRRLRHCVTSTIRFTKDRPDIVVNRLVLFLGGDMVDGLIHDSLERNADIPVGDQVVVGAHILSQSILELAAHFSEILVACAPGNHGRFRKPHEAEMVTQGFDTLMYTLIEQRLKNQENVKFSVPAEFWNHQIVGGQGVLALHGHVGIKGFTGNATYPGYGLRRSVDNLQSVLRQLNKPVRYIFMGHYHSYFSTSHESGLLTINGSMIGNNPYGTASGFPPRPAVQVLQLFNPKYGLTSQHLITPQQHGLTGVPYPWRRNSFSQ